MTQPKPKQTETTPAAAPVPATTLPPPRLVPRPNADLLHGIQWSELQPAEENALREQLLARAVKSLTKMEATRLQNVAEFIDICEKDRGCDSPAEEFVRGLVRTHYWYGLTPDEAAEGLEEFRTSFDYMAESAKMFKERYPKAFEVAAA